jgi:hypothetical protein
MVCAVGAVFCDAGTDSARMHGGCAALHIDDIALEETRMHLQPWTNRFLAALFMAAVTALAGCASVPMTSNELDTQAKTFAPPPADQAGLYVFRNSAFGAALSKTVSIDGVVIGKTAKDVYFYRLIAPGEHTLSTESEFGDNFLTLRAEAGKNHFVRQYIKMGVFIGGSNLEIVSEEDCKKGVLECKRAQPMAPVPAPAPAKP